MKKAKDLSGWTSKVFVKIKPKMIGQNIP